MKLRVDALNVGQILPQPLWIANGFICLAGLCLVLGVCQAHSLCEHAQ